MTPKCSVFIATSLDGFIARKDGALDWLPGSDGTTGGEDYGFGAFFEGVDTLVIGRKTCELALSFPEWPYRGKRVVVLSSRYPATLTPLGENLSGASAAPRDLVRQLEQTGAQHVYVDGGKTIQGFLAAGLIQEMALTRVPVLLGEGIPLFGPLARDVVLQHLDTLSFDSGLVQSRYRVGNTG